jgi:hypothetical protein
LGFHPEHVDDTEHPHNAFKKGTASTDVAVVAPKGKGFPSAMLTAFYTRNEPSPEQHPYLHPHTRLAGTTPSSRP